MNGLVTVGVQLEKIMFKVTEVLGLGMKLVIVNVYVVVTPTTGEADFIESFCCQVTDIRASKKDKKHWSCRLEGCMAKYSNLYFRWL